jgi:hypothetical protein
MSEDITFEAQVSARDGRPFVKMTCSIDGQPVFATQLRPSMATALGLRGVQAAIEAERDAGLIAFLRTLDIGDDQVNGLLIGLRDHRQQFDAVEGSTRPLSDDDPTEVSGG